jgi:hypothetical protein
MCAGNANRQAHHAREQAKRDAAAVMAQQEQAYKEMLSMVPKPPKPEDYTPAPTGTRSNLDDSNSGVRTAKSKRKSTLNMNKGVASLRIPLNTGGGSGGGLNIG